MRIWGHRVRFGNLVGFAIIDSVVRVVVLPWKLQDGGEHREKKVAWRGHIPSTSLAAHVYDRPENVSLAHAKSRKAKDVAIKTARLKMKPHCDFACVNACIYVWECVCLAWTSVCVCMCTGVWMCFSCGYLSQYIHNLLIYVGFIYMIVYMHVCACVRVYLLTVCVGKCVSYIYE